MFNDETPNATGGQTVHSELGIHQKQGVQTLWVFGEEMLVEKAFLTTTPSFYSNQSVPLWGMC